MIVKGKLCRRGHDDGTGHSLRYESGKRECVECRKGLSSGALKGSVRIGMEGRLLFPEEQWFARNLAKLRTVETHRRQDYLDGVALVRGAEDAKLLKEALEKPVVVALRKKTPVVEREAVYA